jgi:hypothetical protein
VNLNEEVEGAVIIAQQERAAAAADRLVNSLMAQVFAP